MDKATQLALALKANIVILKRQLAETESELLKERRAGRPAPWAALSASTNGCFVYTNEQWIVEQESKEERARIKKAGTGKMVAAPAGPLPVPSVPLIPIWDDDGFGKAAGGEGDIDGESEAETEVDQVLADLFRGITGKAQEASILQLQACMRYGLIAADLPYPCIPSALLHA